MAEEHIPVALADAHASVAQRHVPAAIVHGAARARAEEIDQELLLTLDAVLSAMCPEAAELRIGLEPGQQVIRHRRDRPSGDCRATGRYPGSKICSGLTVMTLPHHLSVFAASKSRRDTRGFEPSLLFCSENDPCWPEAKCVGWPRQSCHSSVVAQPATSVASPIIEITGGIDFIASSTCRLFTRSLDPPAAGATAGSSGRGPS